MRLAQSFEVVPFEVGTIVASFELHIVSDGKGKLGNVWGKPAPGYMLSSAVSISVRPFFRVKIVDGNLVGIFGAIDGVNVSR